MKGRVTFEPRPQFEAWLARKYAEQRATQPEPTGSGGFAAR
jgi:hypothetical protein